MFVAISAAEKEFIRKGCDVNVRFDGRGNMVEFLDLQASFQIVFSNSPYYCSDSIGYKDFRHISIENNILPHVNGSSRLRIAESIDILCSVKVRFCDSARDRLNLPNFSCGFLLRFK